MEGSEDLRPVGPVSGSGQHKRYSSVSEGRMRDEAEEADDEASPSFYDLLYCAPDATETQIRQAYKQQALHCEAIIAENNSV